MITRDRLGQSDYGRSLLALFDRLTLHKVKSWAEGGSKSGKPDDREAVATLGEADVVSSLFKSPFGSELDTYHALVLDIDHPCWLIPSTTPGHYHLYVDVPGGIPEQAWRRLLDELAYCKVIEPGYASASKARGFSSARLPWVAKPREEQS